MLFDHRFSVRALPTTRQAGVWAEVLHDQVEQCLVDTLSNWKQLRYGLQGWPVYESML